MASQQQNRQELDERARQGETVIPGGTGGKSLEAQEHLAEGRSRGGQTRKEQLGTQGYQEMGRKGGLSTMDRPGGERVEEEGVDIDESKFTTRNHNKSGGERVEEEGVDIDESKFTTRNHNK